MSLLMTHSDSLTHSLIFRDNDIFLLCFFVCFVDTSEVDLLLRLREARTSIRSPDISLRKVGIEVQYVK